MTEPKFTPGPWLIAQGKPNTFVYALNPQGYNQFWANVQGGNTGPMERTTDGELEANARLIAAAPELLEACQKLAEWDAREKDHAISFRERIDLCDTAFKLMNAAIRKATGAAQ